MCFFTALPVFAEVPRTLDLQTIVYDEDGNITQDEFVDIRVQVVDENEAVLFEEDHFEVPVTNGAVKIDVGETLGGIPADVLDPEEGRKFLNVQVNETSPFSLLPLSSVPYSIWAEKATSVVDNSITASSLQDGIIDVQHFSPNFDISTLGGLTTDAQIPDGIARDDEVNQTISNAVNNLQAVGVQLNQDGAFAAQLGGTVQIAVENLFTRIGEEAGARIAADNNLQNSLNAAVNTLTNSVNTADARSRNNANSISDLNTRLQRVEASQGDVRITTGSTRNPIFFGESNLVHFTVGIVLSDEHRARGASCKYLTFPLLNMWFQHDGAEEHINNNVYIMDVGIDNETVTRGNQTRCLTIIKARLLNGSSGDGRRELPGRLFWELKEFL